jgi:hypothetical protein
MCLGFSIYFSTSITSSPKLFLPSLFAASSYSKKYFSSFTILIPLPPPPNTAFSITGKPIFLASLSKKLGS